MNSSQKVCDLGDQHSSVHDMSKHERHILRCYNYNLVFETLLAIILLFNALECKQ